MLLSMQMSSSLTRDLTSPKIPNISLLSLKTKVKRTCQFSSKQGTGYTGESSHPPIESYWPALSNIVSRQMGAPDYGEPGPPKQNPLPQHKLIATLTLTEDFLDQTMLYCDCYL